MQRIAHLSDLHFGADPELQSKLFEGLVNVFEGQRVDLVAFTGDVFDTSEPAPGLIDGFLKLHAAIEAKLGGPRPTLILPGNHDRRGDGVFSPWSTTLFDGLEDRYASRADVQVLGTRAPFLATRIELKDFPCDVVAYDSTYLPSGIASAGGVIRQEDLLQVGSELANGDASRPLLFLLHHHLIPTPVTDTSVIDTVGRPVIQQLLVGKVLPWLVSNGDREELTMTALGAGSALTTLQTLGRPVLVLHGHKHYATVRLLKGLGGDADLLITSAGSCGLTQDVTGGDYAEAPKLWPSVNFLEVSEQHVEVHAHAWSPTQPDRRSSPRHLVTASSTGVTWNLELPKEPERPFDPVLNLNETRAQLVESKAFVGRFDLVVQRKLEAHPRAWLEGYWEVLEGAPGAVVREIVVDGTPRHDGKCPHRVRVQRDGSARWRIEGAAFVGVADADAGRAFDSVDLLNRSRAQLARLEVHVGPLKTAPFATVTNLATGQERPYPFKRDGDVVTVEYPNCPARTLLRVYWPLEA